MYLVHHLVLHLVGWGPLTKATLKLFTFYVREKLFRTNNITGPVAILHDVISSLDKTTERLQK